MHYVIDTKDAVLKNSIAVLEAWRNGKPVLVDQKVNRNHVRRFRIAFEGSYSYIKDVQQCMQRIFADPQEYHAGCLDALVLQNKRNQWIIIY